MPKVSLFALTRRSQTFASKKAAQAKAAKIYNASGKGHVGKGSK